MAKNKPTEKNKSATGRLNDKIAKLKKSNNNKISKLQDDNTELRKSVQKLNQALTIPKVGQFGECIVNLGECTYSYEIETIATSGGKRWSDRVGLESLGHIDIDDIEDPDNNYNTAERLQALLDALRLKAEADKLHSTNPLHGGVDYEGNLLFPVANGTGPNPRFNKNTLFVDLTSSSIPTKALVTGVYLKYYTRTEDAPKMKLSIYYQYRKFPSAVWQDVYREEDMSLRAGFKVIRTILKKPSGGTDGYFHSSSRYNKGFLRDDYQMRIKVILDNEDPISHLKNVLYSMKIRYMIQ